MTEKILALTGGGAGSYYQADQVFVELFSRDYLKDNGRAALLVEGAEDLKAGPKNSLLYDEANEVFKASRVVLFGWWEVNVRLYAPDLDTAKALILEFKDLVAYARRFKDAAGYWWRVSLRGAIPYKRPSRLEPECRGVKLRFSGWVVRQEADITPITEMTFDKVTVDSSG